MSIDPSQPAPSGLSVSAQDLSALADETRRLCAQLHRGEIDRHVFLERCTRLTTLAIGCSRTGIWVFLETSTGRVLRCLAMYDGVHDRMTHVPDETNQVGAYVAALTQSGVVVADDAQTYPATAGFFAERLAEFGVRSLLASGFSVNGKIFGAFTCTQVGRQVEWTPKQLAVLRQIGAPASLVLFKASRFTADTGFGPLTS